jgi:hypothetical protein
MDFFGGDRRGARARGPPVGHVTETGKRFVITGGTGRFAKTSGPAGISAQIDTARNLNAHMRLTIIGTIQ